MDVEALDAEIKTLLPKEHKDRLQVIARRRHLKLSDILREAIRDKLNIKPGKATLR